MRWLKVSEYERATSKLLLSFPAIEFHIKLAPRLPSQDA